MTTSTATTTPSLRPPGPQGMLHASDLEQVQHDPLQFLLDITREYGELLCWETAYGTTYLVNSPDLIWHVMRSKNYPRGSLLTLVLGQGLLASEGPHWKKQRTLMLPKFHPHAINKFVDDINRISRSQMRGWYEAAKRGETVDLAAEWLHLTLEVVVETLFSGDLHGERDAFYEAVKLLLRDIGGFVQSEFVAPMMISPERNRRVAATLGQINEIVYRVIRERRQHDNKHDLLSLLLAARYDDGEELSDKEIRDEIVTMVFAGNETTATALGWALYTLVQHSDEHQRVQDELSKVLNGRQAELADVPNLPYLQMTFNEGMRLYPPVWSIFRKVLEDEKIGDYMVDGGHTIVVSPYTIHHNPKYWDEPEKFDPTRFEGEALAERPRRAYIPFGDGPHVCIGKRFATLESHLVLATFHQCFDAHIADEAVVEPEPLVTLRFKSGLPMTLTPRPEAERILSP